MAEPRHREWDALEALWKGAPLAGDAPEDMCKAVDARRRRLLRGAVRDYALVLVALGLFVTLVRHASSLERLAWAFGLLVFAVHAVAEWAGLRRNAWRAAALGTAEFLTQTLADATRRMRLVTRAWQLYGAMLLIHAAIWAWRYLGDPAGFEALRERAVMTVFAICVFNAALAAWSWVYAWRGRAERSALELLRAELDAAA